MKKVIIFVCILFPLVFCFSQSYSQSVKQTLNSAIANYTAGSYEKSIELFTNVISTCDVYDAPAYYGRGLAYDKLGKFNSAIENYTKAITANSNYWKAYFNRGCVYYDLKKYELAIKDFSKVIKLNPLDADAYLIRGSAKIKLGRTKDGYRDIKKSYKMNS
jgi:tetratricopeptide (TPR) repeat protein